VLLGLLVGVSTCLAPTDRPVPALSAAVEGPTGALEGERG
jgi:hypothetical protein